MSDYITPEQTQALISIDTASEGEEWLQRELDRINPWRHEQGHEWGNVQALITLVFELRAKLETKP